MTAMVTLWGLPSLRSRFLALRQQKRRSIHLSTLTARSMWNVAEDDPSFTRAVATAAAGASSSSDSSSSCKSSISVKSRALRQQAYHRRHGHTFLKHEGLLHDRCTGRAMRLSSLRLFPWHHSRFASTSVVCIRLCSRAWAASRMKPLTWGAEVDDFRRNEWCCATHGRSCGGQNLQER